MKKSNKLTVFYVISSVSLFLVLLLGGVYGVYVSVGLNFVRGAPITNEPGVENGLSNVSFAGTVNYEPSMIGVIFLSIILVVISVFDFISLIKQVIFFKQFKAVRNSKIGKKIQEKTPSKGGVIFLTFVIDILALVAGVVGLFINSRSFAAGANEMGWLFYLVDGLVSVLSLLSIILLIAKLKNKATENTASKKESVRKVEGVRRSAGKKQVGAKEISQMEYNLMKLDAMKKGKIVTDDEYKKLRKRILDLKSSENVFVDSQ